MHGDCHGVHTIPLSIAEALPEAVKSILDREAELIKFCQSPELSLEKLTTILNNIQEFARLLRQSHEVMTLVPGGSPVDLAIDELSAISSTGRPVEERDR